MATELDTTLRESAQALILELGRLATFHVAARSYSSSTGITTETITTYSKRISPPAPLRSDRPDSETVVYLAAKDLEFTPYVGLRMTDGSTTYAVTRIAEYGSGEQTAVWELEIER